MQWPCNEQFPDGRERLYTDWIFPTTLADVESYGHDLYTGTTISPEAYKAMNPNGRAILKACHFSPQDESADEDYPFLLLTGRVFAQFHSTNHLYTFLFYSPALTPLLPINSSHEDRPFEGAP